MMQLDNTMVNVPQVTTSGARDILTKYFLSMIKAGIPYDKFQVPILFGSPGLGKSQAIEQMADTIADATGKDVVVKIIQLSMYGPADLLGIPFAAEGDNEEAVTAFLKPEFLDVPDDEDTIVIFFLDDLSASTSPQTLACAFRILLNHEIGTHSLPEQSILVAATNKITDKSGVNKLPMALCNRMMSLEVLPDPDEWIRYAGMAGFDERILGFISERPDRLFTFDPSKSSIPAFATPRSWEFVDRILKSMDICEESKVLIGGCVSTEVAAEFLHWVSINKDLPKVEDIFKGKAKKLGKRSPDVQAFIEPAIVGYAIKDPDDKTGIANAFEWMDENFSPEFTVLALTDIESIKENFRATLMRMPEYTKLVKKVGKLVK